MKVVAVSSSLLSKGAQRLDCGPYTSGVAQTIESVNRLHCDRLGELTHGPYGGVFRPPIFGMKFAQNTLYKPALGVRFLTSSSMLRADLANLPLVSRRMAESSKYSMLRIQRGMTLLSCSGSIGRPVYARPDMNGAWSSQAVMKILPNPKAVPPGYLYAFLSGRFGQVLVRGGTYGTMIPQVEREHLIGIPVPRLSDDTEGQANRLMDKAANLLTRYQTLVCEATDRLFASVGLKDVTPGDWHNPGSDTGFSVGFPRWDSLRALNFNPRFESLKARIQRGPWKKLGDICEPGTLTRGGRFKRIDADPEHSLRLVGQKQLFRLQPEGRWIARFALGSDVTVEPGTVLIAARDTLGENELYSRAEFAWGPGVQLAYSEDILRAKADKDIMPRGCLFAFLRSETAFRMLRSISVGSKLQDHHHIFRAEIPVPYPPKEVQNQVHDLVVEAYDCRHRGVALENEARTLVERAIEEAT